MLPDDCRLLDPLAVPDTVVVGVTEPIDAANKSQPTNPSERFVFGALFDVTPAADCTGPLGEHAASHDSVAWDVDRIVALPRNGRDPTIVYKFSIQSDPRDLLDDNIDVLLTADPSVIEYASSNDTYEVVRLPWTRTYVFAGPPAVPDEQTRDFGRRLVGAVRGEVRAAEPPFPHEALPCATRPPAPDTDLDRRIVYDDGDPIARDLADRLVALSSSGDAFGGARSLRSVGLERGAFETALRANREFGYVVHVRRRPVVCPSLLAEAFTPLVDARWSIIVRRWTVGIDVMWDGTPRMVWR